MNFTRLAEIAARWIGTVHAFIISAVWFAVTWRFFGLDIANIGVSFLSLLMLIVLQASQNRDGAAMQTKLDELIRASEARNKFIGIDHLVVEEVEEIRKEVEQ